LTDCKQQGWASTNYTIVIAGAENEFWCIINQVKYSKGLINVLNLQCCMFDSVNLELRLVIIEVKALKRDASWVILQRAVRQSGGEAVTFATFECGRAEYGLPVHDWEHTFWHV
jgi:hypothetical protein